jgi:hypothetical protein
MITYPRFFDLKVRWLTRYTSRVSASSLASRGNPLNRFRTATTLTVFIDLAPRARSSMSNPAANEVSRDNVSLIPYSRNFARRFCRDAYDADDLVQETLVTWASLFTRWPTSDR